MANLGDFATGLFGKSLVDFEDEPTVPGVPPKRRMSLLGIPMTALGITREQVGAATKTPEERKADWSKISVASPALAAVGMLKDAAGTLFPQQEALGKPSTLKRNFL